MTDTFVCGLCAHFNTGDYENSRVLCTQDKDGVCGALLMHCNISNSLQHLTFCSCRAFLPAKAFLCVATDQFVETTGCCKRQIDETHLPCVNCAQGLMVLSMMRGGSKRWEKQDDRN